MLPELSGAGHGHAHAHSSSTRMFPGPACASVHKESVNGTLAAWAEVGVSLFLFYIFITFECDALN